MLEIKSKVLTDEEKEIILEMAEFFYPMYKPEYYKGEQVFGFYISDHIQSGTSFVGIMKDDGNLLVHWSEFLSEYINKHVGIGPATVDFISSVHLVFRAKRGVKNLLKPVKL